MYVDLQNFIFHIFQYLLLLLATNRPIKPQDFKDKQTKMTETVNLTN